MHTQTTTMRITRKYRCTITLQRNNGREESHEITIEAANPAAKQFRPTHIHRFGGHTDTDPRMGHNS